MQETCNTFWGSHGCELPKGHDPEQEHPIHQCHVEIWNEDGPTEELDICSQAQYVDDDHSWLRYCTSEAGAPVQWSEWQMSSLGLFL